MTANEMVQKRMKRDAARRTFIAAHLKEDSTELTRLKRWLIALGIFGAVLSVSGVLLWYFKLQVHIDRAVAEQAAEMLKNL